MNNRKLGNTFEQDLCDLLYGYGFWAKNLKQDSAGQPADIIAVRNGKAYLIDAKVCSDGKFPLSRVEENQQLAMDMWESCGNGQGWFAMKLPMGEVYMIPHFYIKAYTNVQSALTAAEIHELGKPLGKWVSRCK